jgi:hypothetical protein
MRRSSGMPQQSRVALLRSSQRGRPACRAPRARGKSTGAGPSRTGALPCVICASAAVPGRAVQLQLSQASRSPVARQFDAFQKRTTFSTRMLGSPAYRGQRHSCEFARIVGEPPTAPRGAPAGFSSRLFLGTPNDRSGVPGAWSVSTPAGRGGQGLPERVSTRSQATYLE